MKRLLPVLALVASFNSFSSTTDTKTFVYDGSRDSVELVLRTEETKAKEVESTCSERELVGHRSICTGRSYGPGPYRRGPYYPGPYYPRHPGPYSSQCYSEPVYREVPYRCMQPSATERVKLFDVEARVIVDVTKLSQEVTSGETFRVTLRGDDLLFTATGSKKFFIVRKNQDVRTSIHGSFKAINALYVVELVDAAPVLSSLKMSNLEVVNSAVKFKLSGEAASEMGYSLKIVKNKFLASDKLVLEKYLDSSEVVVNQVGNESEVSVDLDKLGVNLDSGKFSITAKASARFKGPVLNSNQFEDLSVSSTLVYKVR